MSEEVAPKGTWDEQRLIGTKYQGIKKGTLKWKQLTSKEKQEYNTLAMGGTVALTRVHHSQDAVNKALDDGNYKLAENLAEELPSQDTLDDVQPGDISPSDAQRLGISFTKVRNYEDYRIARDLKFGYWHIWGLESLGRYTSLKEAQKGLDAYIEKRRKEVM